MELKEFIESYREAFGENAQLPLLFGYSNEPVAPTAKIGGCFFKPMLLQVININTEKAILKIKNGIHRLQAGKMIRVMLLSAPAVQKTESRGWVHKLIS